MLYQDILNNPPKDFDLTTIQDARDVSKFKIIHDTYGVEINKTTYLLEEFKEVVTELTAKLFQLPDKSLLVTNTDVKAHLITPTEIEVVPIYDFQLEKHSKSETEYLTEYTNYQTEKVVGTTFRPQPEVSQFNGDIDGNIIRGKAILVPEPDNEFDPTAVAVIAELKDGSPHHVGYIPKDSPLKQYIDKSTPCDFKVICLEPNYNNSYQIRIATPS